MNNFVNVLYCGQTFARKGFFCRNTRKANATPKMSSADSLRLSTLIIRPFEHSDKNINETSFEFSDDKYFDWDECDECITVITDNNNDRSFESIESFNNVNQSDIYNKNNCALASKSCESNISNNNNYSSASKAYESDIFNNNNHTLSSKSSSSSLS